MARESSVRIGSGISALREGLVPGHTLQLAGMCGTNSVIINYEDVNSVLGIVQSSGLAVGEIAAQITGPENRLRGRRQIIIQNLGSGAAYIGASNLTPTNGLQIAAGTMLTLDVLDVGDIYAISDSVSDLRILELK